MRMTTRKGVGLTAVVVTVGSALIFTGKLAGVSSPATPEPQSGQEHGCLPNQNHTDLVKDARLLTYGTNRGSSATQILWWPPAQGGPYATKDGPEAKIWSADNSTDPLDAEGRIVARIWIEFGHNRAGYPRLRLPEDTSWVKICKTTTPDKLWALIIPLDQTVGLRVHPNVYDNTSRVPAPGPMALWDYVPQDDHACMTCGGHWCQLR